ncbi:hypothetical protein [Bacillus seohaeanensis]|uniref:Uncharacterized protein n=1 Tax=Bacillus seohaeanensis TaxID=284580 RepID=A0ABW5RTS0_9BACI
MSETIEEQQRLGMSRVKAFLLEMELILLTTLDFPTFQLKHLAKQQKSQ